MFHFKQYVMQKINKVYRRHLCTSAELYFASKETDNSYVITETNNHKYNFINVTKAQNVPINCSKIKK